MKTIDTLRSNTKRAKDTLVFSKHATRALFSIVPDVMATQAARARTYPELNRYVDMAEGGVNILWTAGQIGREGIRVGREEVTRRMPMVGRSVATVALKKIGLEDRVPLSPEAKFYAALHGLEAGIRAVARHTQDNLEVELAALEPDEHQTEEERIAAKERTAEVIRAHIQPIVTLGMVWRGLIKTEPVVPGPTYDPMTDTDYISEFGSLLNGDMYSEFTQLVTARMQEEVLLEDDNVGRPSNLQIYRAQRSSPLPENI